MAETQDLKPSDKEENSTCCGVAMALVLSLPHLERATEGHQLVNTRELSLQPYPGSVNTPKHNCS